MAQGLPSAVLRPPSERDEVATHTDTPAQHCSGPHWVTSQPPDFRMFYRASEANMSYGDAVTCRLPCTGPGIITCLTTSNFPKEAVASLWFASPLSLTKERTKGLHLGLPASNLDTPRAFSPSLPMLGLP